MPFSYLDCFVVGPRLADAHDSAVLIAQANRDTQPYKQRKHTHTHKRDNETNRKAMHIDPSKKRTQVKGWWAVEGGEEAQGEAQGEEQGEEGGTRRRTRQKKKKKKEEEEEQRRRRRWGNNNNNNNNDKACVRSLSSGGGVESPGVAPKGVGASIVRSLQLPHS